ncbi:MAG: sigma-70 family RNA polymerase sigma factor [Pseudomonadota bacterium]
MPEVYPRLWRYALSLTRDTSDAADLTQETVTQGLRKASQFQPGTQVDRWLFSILHRLWLNQVRAGKVRRGTGLVPVEEAGLRSLDDPEATFFGSEVLSAVASLSDVQRVTVMLVYVEGYTYAEAAELVGVPVGTIMSRLAAARLKLKDLLGDKE